MAHSRQWQLLHIVHEIVCDHFLCSCFSPTQFRLGNNSVRDMNFLKAGIMCVQFPCSCISPTQCRLGDSSVCDNDVFCQIVCVQCGGVLEFRWRSDWSCGLRWSEKLVVVWAKGHDQICNTQRLIQSLASKITFTTSPPLATNQFGY
jgi:hypothetical protein